MLIGSEGHTKNTAELFKPRGCSWWLLLLERSIGAAGTGGSWAEGEGTSGASGKGGAREAREEESLYSFVSAYNRMSLNV